MYSSPSFSKFNRKIIVSLDTQTLRIPVMKLIYIYIFHLEARASKDSPLEMDVQDHVITEEMKH